MRPRPDKVWVVFIHTKDGENLVTVCPSKFGAGYVVAKYVIDEWPRRYYSHVEMPKTTYVEDFFRDNADTYEIFEREIEHGEFETEGQEPIVITELTNIGTVCPTQWEGKTEDGRGVYIRYRWGYLRLDVDGQEILGRQVGGEYDGLMGNIQLQYWLSDVAMLPADVPWGHLWEGEENANV